jgi:hypothetical protein
MHCIRAKSCSEKALNSLKSLQNEVYAFNASEVKQTKLSHKMKTITDGFLNQRRVNVCGHMLKIPVGMYKFSITCPLILITSPTAIFNFPVNSFSALDTALVLTSANFHIIFPPSPPPSCLATPLVAFLNNCHEAPSLLHVHIHLLSSDRERHL